MLGIKRREFITLLGGMVACRRGQQRTAMPVIGVLSIDSPCLPNGSKKCQTKV
jgi:hypothetical protein